MAEIALGAFPIFFTALRGLDLLRGTIHKLRHYRTDIRWLRTKVEVQAGCFRGEIQHLVFDILDDRMAQSLIIDDKHEYWQSKELADAVAVYMGALRHEFDRAIQEITSASNQIEAKLAMFAPPDVKSPLFKTTKDKFRMAFRKEEYQEDILELKEWTAELQRIRKQARAMNRHRKRGKETEQRTEKERPATASSSSSRATTARQYRAIRHISLGFQALLRRQWSCDDVSHSHSARLFLRCISTTQPNLVWLFESTGQASLRNRLLFNVSSQQLGLITPKSIDLNPFEDFDEPTPKRQKVSPDRHVPSVLPTDSDADLSKSVTSLCLQLERAAITSRPQSFDYIDSQRRDQFKLAPKGSGGWGAHKITSLAELLNRRVRDVMLDRERIQLALALVKGTLTNHSTLGWPQGGLMEGITFFYKSDIEVDVKAILNTLNINVHMGDSTVNDTDMEGDTMSVPEDELEFVHGIRNQVLYQLGVALLSIGLWTKVNWEDIVGVRRKAAAIDSLGGKQFRVAVKKLIHGNFGVDPVDLNNERLQLEILKTVVDPLERLVASYRRVESEADSKSGENEKHEFLDE